MSIILSAVSGCRKPLKVFELSTYTWKEDFAAWRFIASRHFFTKKDSPWAPSEKVHKRRGTAKPPRIRALNYKGAFVC